MGVDWRGLQARADSADNRRYSAQDAFFQQRTVKIRLFLSCRSEFQEKRLIFFLLCVLLKRQKEDEHSFLYRSCSPCRAACRAKHSRRGMMTSWKHRPVSSVSWARSAIFWTQWQASTTSSTENLALPEGRYESVCFSNLTNLTNSKVHHKQVTMRPNEELMKPNKA